MTQRQSSRWRKFGIAALVIEFAFDFVALAIGIATVHTYPVLLADSVIRLVLMSACAYFLLGGRSWVRWIFTVFDGLTVFALAVCILIYAVTAGPHQWIFFGLFSLPFMLLYAAMAMALGFKPVEPEMFNKEEVDTRIAPAK